MTATRQAISERDRMVAGQIATRGVDDPLVLDAMRAVPREDFVPADLAEYAYEDGPLPIGQLEPGGRLVMPLGSEPRAQRLIRRTRTGPETYTQDDLEWVTFVPLIGEQGWPDAGKERS